MHTFTHKVYSDAYAAHCRQILGVGAVDVAIVRPTFSVSSCLREREERERFLA